MKAYRLLLGTVLGRAGIVDRCAPAPEAQWARGPILPDSSENLVASPGVEPDGRPLTREGVSPETFLAVLAMSLVGLREARPADSFATCVPDSSAESGEASLSVTDHALVLPA